MVQAVLTAVGTVGGFLVGGPVGAAAGATIGYGAGSVLEPGKRGPTRTAIGQVTRDDATAMISNQDELRKRKGGAADILNGTTGAEAVLSGGKLVLGS